MLQNNFKTFGLSTTGSVVFFHRNVRFDGNTINERPLGGMETSIIYMARELARLGWDVKVFNHCERPGNYEGVEYVPVDKINEYKSTHETDVFISVRYLDPFLSDLNSKLRIFWTGDAFDQPVLQDLQNKAVVDNVDRVFAKSRWHAQTLADFFNITHDKFFVTRNGINIENFTDNGLERKKGKIVYSSTPYRGLDVLFDIFPRIRSEVPYAELFVFSGMAVYDVSKETDRQRYGSIYAKADQPGVHMIGNIPQKQLAKELMSAQLMLYPNHFAETSCLAVLEAQAAGTPVITTALGALPESVIDGYSGVIIPGNSHDPAYQDRMVNEAVFLLRNHERWEQLSRQAVTRIETDYTWHNIALEWQNEFDRCLQNQNTSHPARNSMEISSATEQNNYRISLCMIAKNEEEMLRECLERVKPIVDEMIVVDTGSTDETKDIAESVGAMVYDFPWQDDFSKARNFAINKARSEWILVLDADEYLSTKDLSTIKSLTDRSDVDGFRLCQRSYTDRVGTRNFYPCKGEYEEEKGFLGYVTAHLVRLFRNDPKIFFEGQVHEVVERVMQAHGKTWESTEIPLHHYGFSKSDTISGQKKKIYHKLGKIKAESDPDDPRAYFDLGVQLIEIEEYNEALSVLDRAYRLRPDWVPLLFNIGLAHDKLNDTMEAIRFYQAALAYESHHHATLSNLGLLHHRCGRWDEAMMAFKKCLEKQPDYLPALVNIASLLQEKKRFSEANDYLNQARNLCPDFSSVYYSLALNYRDLQDWDNAIQCLERWIVLDNNHELEGRLLLAETWILQENWDEAISQCDHTLELLALPRNIVISSFYDLAEIYITIAKSLDQREKPHLARIAENLATVIKSVAQITYT